MLVVGNLDFWMQRLLLFLWVRGHMLWIRNLCGMSFIILVSAALSFTNASSFVFAN